MLKSKKTETNTFALVIKQETLNLFNFPMYSNNILFLSYWKKYVWSISHIISDAGSGVHVFKSNLSRCI